MTENIKLLLGDNAANYSDSLIQYVYKQAAAEIAAYCNIKQLDEELAFIAERMTVIKLYRQYTEGLDSQSTSGVNENYIDGFPSDVLAVLNRKRKIKVI